MNHLSSMLTSFFGVLPVLPGPLQQTPHGTWFWPLVTIQPLGPCKKCLSERQIWQHTSVTPGYKQTVVAL